MEKGQQEENLETTAGHAPSGRPRLAALDAQRGLIIALMAIDHVSMLVARSHSGEFWGTPLPAYPDIFWFLTRWITHMCAPGFFLLMGAGMVLFSESRRRAGWSSSRIAGFFAVRGLLLMALQFTLENWAWSLGDLFASPGALVFRGGPLPGGGGGGASYFGVLFALGAAMLFWGALTRLPLWAAGAISLAAALAMPFAVPDPEEVRRLYDPVARILLVAGHTDRFVVFYPVVPWLAPCGLGIVLARLLTDNPHRFRIFVLAAAIISTAAFPVLRESGWWANLNALPPGWTGFLNAVKYPPSLSFFALTLAINFFLILLWKKTEPALRNPKNPLLVFGRTPLFFYILHLWLFALMGAFFPKGGGLLLLYGAWLAGLAILYPLCLYYGKFKAARPATSLWRLF